MSGGGRQPFHGRGLRVGRGLNPRPESEMNLLIGFFVFCLLLLCSRVGGSFRSGVQPPTGSRSESSTPAEYALVIPNPEKVSSRNESFNWFFCFLSVVALLSRGWIVPVGGSTPDRLKLGRLKREEEGGSEKKILIINL